VPPGRRYLTPYNVRLYARVRMRRRVSDSVVPAIWSENLNRESIRPSYAHKIETDTRPGSDKQRCFVALVRLRLAGMLGYSRRPGQNA